MLPEWLTINRLLIILSLPTICFLFGSLLWLLVDESAEEIRQRPLHWWRARQRKKAAARARKFRVEWNPRSTAMRGEF